MALWEHMNTIFPYTYLKDKNGWIHIAKWFLDDNHIITKPYYSPEGIKCKTVLCKDMSPCGFPLSHISRYDYIISTEHIDKIIEPQVIGQHISQPPIVNKIIEYCENCAIKISLFGSRLLKINKETSDWDFVIDIDGTPKQFLDTLLKKNNELRYLNKNEIEWRISRYSIPYPISNVSSLRLLFYNTCIYLKSLTIGEIGLFFENSKHKRDYTTVDAHKILHRNMKTTSISGVIKKGNGESFLLPRIFTITDNMGIDQKIISLSWEIGGIEELNGKTILLDKTIKIRDKLYFMFDTIKNLRVFT